MDITNRRACCPAHHQSGHCSRLRIREKGQVKIFYRFEWRKRCCQHCPLRAQCVPAGQKHRSLIVGEHHEILQQRRIEQRTEA